MADIQTGDKVEEMLKESLEANKKGAMEGSSGLETPEEVATHILGTTMTAAQGYLQLGVLDQEVAKKFISSSIDVVLNIAEHRSQSVDEYKKIMVDYWNQRKGSVFADWSPWSEGEKSEVASGDITSQ